MTSPLAALDRLLKSKRYADSHKYMLFDENTGEACLPRVVNDVESLQNATFFEIPAGEESKSIEVAKQLWISLLDEKADRNSVIINIGGGCVSDVGGFVAAGYKRGIRYINVPTTLVGMVDAAIGGKTAVNMNGIKNAVGFFHMPEAVCIEPDFLDTLPEREIRCGVFEMMKTLLLTSQEGVNHLESIVHTSDHLRGASLIELISQCADFKNTVVKADAKETSVRKILNLGHTFAHGIESMTLGSLSHGEAVGLGMACALYLSVRKLGLSEKIYDDYVGFMTHLMPVESFSLRQIETVVQYMHNDKKSRGEDVCCVLLRDYAEPVIDVEVNDNELRDALIHLAKHRGI